MHYHQCADDIQLYFSTLGQPQNGKRTLPLLGGYDRLERKKNFRPNPGKIEWLSVLGHPHSWTLHLNSEWWCTSPVKVGAQFRGPPRFCAKIKWQPWPRGLLHRFILHTLVPPLDLESLLMVTLALITSHLDYCNMLYSIWNHHWRALGSCNWSRISIVSSFWPLLLFHYILTALTSSE